MGLQPATEETGRPRRAVLLVAAVVVLCGGVAVAYLLRPSSTHELKPPELVSPLTVDVSETANKLVLKRRQDYIVRLPSRPITARGGVSIVGGHNVVLIGGEIENEQPISSSESSGDAYGLYLKDQTGTVHVEGVWIHGRGIGQALVLDQGDGAVVQVRNSRLEPLHPVGYVHTDGIQTWRGPARLLLDNVTIRTAGVGLQTMPHQFENTATDNWEYRRVNIEQTTPDAYALWKAPHAGGWWRELHDDFWVANKGYLAWPNESAWNPGGQAKVEGERFHLGLPPGGDFVPATAVGIGYASPN